MNYYLKGSLVCLLSSGALTAQDKNAAFGADFDKAEKIYNTAYQDGKAENLSYSKGAYTEARPLFMALHATDPENRNIDYKIGVCFLSSKKHRADAIPYFVKAITLISNDYQGSSYKERGAPLLSYKLLGDAYHLNYQFDMGIAAYAQFIKLEEELKRPDKKLIEEATRNMAQCRTGKQLMGSPVKGKIENMGIAVNSLYADYAPVLTADQQTLFFTSRRPNTTGGGKDDEGNYMEDIYMSKRGAKGWTEAVNIGPPVNTTGNEASVGISPDGQTILIYKDDNGDGNIYSTSLEGDVWTIPVKLNENINTKYWEPSAFISADGQTLYFTSDRPGGYGGRDLYTSQLTAAGDWGKAVNMGPTINTPFDEDAPFIHPDGVTFTFSSNGHNTMGGFDIFTSLRSEEGLWSEPMNVGYPINTPDDDIFYVLSADGQKAYFSSFREGSVGEKDNYMITFLNRKETPLTLMKGTVVDESGNVSKRAVITVTDNETGQVVGVYHANSKTGQFLYILTPGKNYNITYQTEGHLFYSENRDINRNTGYYEISRAISMTPIVVGSKITLNNIFFDFDKSTLRTISHVELMNLVHLLKSNPTMKVEISGHTDSKGSDEYNQKLSEERAQAVVAFLHTEGIESNRMTAKGYGKTIPVAENKHANGKDNPEGRQLNRRVELKITEMNGL
jgi:outer membrane protein OmpA-like peptidoglycan-associated protein